ncbi:MAG: lactonase family protein [Gaiellales bacterium]
MRTRRIALAVPVLGAALLAAPAGASAGAAHGAAFTLSNAASGNRVVVFAREPDGGLNKVGSVATGGRGSGANLGSQGSLTLSPDGSRLYAVNAGSDSLSVLGVSGTHVWREQVVGSGGSMPVSVTAGGRRVYVVNAGGSPDVAGFRVTTGGLARIGGGTRALGAGDSGPAQVSLSPSGRVLVVTNKTSNTIDTFAVHADGSLGPAQSHASNGAQPFGFAFTPNGRLIVSDAAQAPTSAVTSYRITGGGLHTVSGPLQTNQLAACWVAVRPGGRYAFVSDAHSGTIAALRVTRDGGLSLVDPSGVSGSGGSGSTTLDEAVTPDGRILSVLVDGTRPGVNALVSFRILADGSLHRISTSGAILTSDVGLVVN